MPVSLTTYCSHTNELNVCSGIEYSKAEKGVKVKDKIKYKCKEKKKEKRCKL